MIYVLFILLKKNYFCVVFILFFIYKFIDISDIFFLPLCCAIWKTNSIDMYVYIIVNYTHVTYQVTFLKQEFVKSLT